jgi:hypothetical protein
MADLTIPNMCKFDIINNDQIKLTTQTNGDRVTITGVHFTPEQGAALSYLINDKKPLTIVIKLRDE